MGIIKATATAIRGAAVNQRKEIFVPEKWATICSSWLVLGFAILIKIFLVMILGSVTIPVSAEFATTVWHQNDMNVPQNSK